MELSNQHQLTVPSPSEQMPVLMTQCGQLARCLVCGVRARNGLCGTLFGDIGEQSEDLQSTLASVAQTDKFARRRRTIYRANEPCNSVAIISDGWACAYIQLPKGNRQILSFLLPGDITSAAAVFEDRSEVSVEAITDVRYCVIDKRRLGEAVQTNREVFDTFSKMWARRKNEIENLAADLGHRTAEERIARLILSLRNRHAERNLVQDGRFPFPLRLQHIADATGLTVVHVSRVIGAMRRLGLMEIEGRLLTILDLPELQNLGNS